MTQRRTVSGRRSVLAWLAIVLVLVLAIVLAAFVFVIGPQQQLRQQVQATAEAKKAEVERLYAAGVAFQNVGDWDAAEAEFKQVIILDANYEDVQVRLAEVKTRLAESTATATVEAAAASPRAPTATPSEALTPTPPKVPTPTPTPTSTSASGPTYTPTITRTPTNTPKPTATRTSPPTRTPTPTMTLTPTNTPLPTTEPGSILEIGETWVADKLELTFTGRSWKPKGYTLQVTFSLLNRTEEGFYINVYNSSFMVISDTGVEWEPWSDKDGLGYCRYCQANFIDLWLSPGKPYVIERQFGYGTFPSSAQYFDVIVKDIYGIIENAQCRINIPRP